MSGEFILGQSRYNTDKDSQPSVERRANPRKHCEYCNKPLEERYHLKICPDCRKATIAEYFRSIMSE